MVLSFIRLTEIPVPGVTNGKQVIRISDRLEKADMMQLLMYTLGMYNTFRRPDRDSFVNVMYENIKDGKFWCHAAIVVVWSIKAVDTSYKDILLTSRLSAK
jgi:hypothetical protein